MNNKINEYLNCKFYSPYEPVKAPSTDGIDIDFCSNVLVKNCILDVNDDAIALMYCLSEPKINLVGISTVHGNQESYKTFKNALRVLYITGNINKMKTIKVISGANKPLNRPSQICGEIHGQSGLGGVDWDEIDKKIESLGIDLSYGEKQTSEDVAEVFSSSSIDFCSGITHHGRVEEFSKSIFSWHQAI